MKKKNYSYSKNIKNGIYKNYFKTLIDITFSIILAIILSPLLLIIALLVKLKLGSPVIFKQERPGMNEKLFTIYKFRTMTSEKDESGQLLPDKVRLTKFGRLLRSTSLDELPELINIIQGNMSFVGPRPLSKKYLPYYNKMERKRHEVRPGLTGLAQINGRNKATWEQRFELDINYVNNLSLLNDLKIVMKTILVVIRRNDVVVRDKGTIENFHQYRLRQIKENKEK